MNQDNVLYEVPRIVDAFKILNDDLTVSLSQAEEISILNIPNISNFNPKYTVIAYNILISLKRNPPKNPFDIFILKNLPETNSDYAIYNGKTVFEYLKLMFPELKIDQNIIIAKHLELVLTYMDAIDMYINSNPEEPFEKEFYEIEDEDLFEFEDED